MSLKKSLLLLCCAFSTSAFAERWFEVEVLVFKQRSAPYLQEDFSLKHDKITAKNRLDLLTALYSDKAQQDCINGDSRFNSSSFTDSLVNSARSNLCDDSIDYVKSYEQLPLTPDAPVKDDMIEPYLLAPLPKESQKFTHHFLISCLSSLSLRVRDSLCHSVGIKG